jgi:hypothetical protein
LCLKLVDLPIEVMNSFQLVGEHEKGLSRMLKYLAGPPPLTEQRPTNLNDREPIPRGGPNRIGP